MVILKFLIILLILITVHEFGHFIVAKIFKVYVTEFALGFGPKIFSHKGRETEFSIRILPLGGYAAMVGEDGEISEDQANIPFERTLKGVNRFKQFLIMFAGAFMNLLLAFIIFCGIAATVDTGNPQPVIGTVTKGSPAQKAGLKANDEVYKVVQAGKVTEIGSYADLSLFSQFNKDGESYEMYIKRDKEEKVLKITPEYNKTEKRYLAGFSQGVLKAAKNPGEVLKNGLALSADTTRNLFTSLKMLFNGQAGLQDLSGPVGMVKLTEDISATSGTLGLINFTALLSINLAVLNLLPIPALDGGRILILAIEAITRRKLSPKIESALIGVSFVLLMGLILVVTLSDILKLFK